MTALRRSAVQGEEAKALDLKIGEISAVLELAAAFVLMKVESKEPMGYRVLFDRRLYSR